MSRARSMGVIIVFKLFFRGAILYANENMWASLSPTGCTVRFWLGRKRGLPGDEIVRCLEDLWTRLNDGGPTICRLG